MDRRKFMLGSALSPVALSALSTSGNAAAPESTTVWEIGPKGPFDTMRKVERRLPELAPGQAVVQVSRAALAARDLAIARGWFLEDKPPSLVPLSEGVGTIVALNSDDGRLKVGDRVVCAHFANWDRGDWSPARAYATDIGNTADGWLAQHAVLPVSGLAVVPDNVSDDTASTLSGSALTAWHALHEYANVRSGDTVLTLGTGGVSTWGLLLAKAAGARVAITSSSDEKLANMKELGADITVNYKTTPDWGTAIAEQSGGVDIVLENVGRPTLDQSMMACGNNARIVMIGTGPMPKQLPKMPGLYIKNIELKAISNGSRAMLENLLRALSASGTDAVIARRFAFDDARQAFDYMAQSGHSGKVIIDVG